MVETNLVVVSRPFLVINKRSVGLLDLHKLLLRAFIVFIQIWMIEHGHFQPGLSDLSLMKSVRFYYSRLYLLAYLGTFRRDFQNVVKRDEIFESGGHRPEYNIPIV